MPRRVDHVEQRRMITDAVTRLATRDDITAVTVRRVAAEAGISPGRVQHYFASKDELLLAALAQETARTAGRIDEVLADLGPRATARDRTRAAVHELLPLDDRRRFAALLARVVVPTAADDTGTIGDPDRDPALVTTRAIRARLDAARDTGELRPDLDIDHETVHLSTTVTGLAESLLTGRITTARALATVDYLLTRTFRHAPTESEHRRPPRRPDPDATPDAVMRILRTAERHFAERGIDGASLREILREAGHSNAGAIQYYFGDRRGLVRAVVTRHRRDEEAHRNTLLDDYERAGVTDRRALAEALVVPIAAKLDDPDGGRAYLRVCAEYYLSLTTREIAGGDIPDTSVARWHRLLDLVADDDRPDDDMERFAPRLLAVRVTLVQLSLLAATDPQPADQVTVSFLVDVITAVLGTHLSPQTTAVRARHPHHRDGGP